MKLRTWECKMNGGRYVEEHRDDNGVMNYRYWDMTGRHNEVNDSTLEEAIGVFFKDGMRQFTHFYKEI